MEVGRTERPVELGGDGYVRGGSTVEGEQVKMAEVRVGEISDNQLLYTRKHGSTRYRLLIWARSETMLSQLGDPTTEPATDGGPERTQPPFSAPAATQANSRQLRQ